MNRPQFILIAIALLAVAGLYFFGPTVDPNRKATQPATVDSTRHFDANTYIQSAISSLPAKTQQQILALSNTSQSANVSVAEATHAYHELSLFWRDTIPNPFLHYYFGAKAAELENTEKSLTFAAHSILGYLPFVENHDQQAWMATRGKELFDKALQVNPANDSSIVGAGACVMYGAATDQQATMQGIMQIREVVERDSTNMFAQYMLGVAGMASNQLSKAAERFEKVARAQPNNLEVLFKLAEVNEMLENKTRAVFWYRKIIERIGDKGIQAEIEKRIELLNGK